MANCSCIRTSHLYPWESIVVIVGSVAYSTGNSRDRRYEHISRWGHHAISAVDMRDFASDVFGISISSCEMPQGTPWELWVLSMISALIRAYVFVRSLGNFNGKYT